ncbi:MAG: hypothetical protein ACRC7N_03725 [Clostridium sp.]
MELKNELIKHTISFLNGYFKYLVIDCYNTASIPKLVFKILTNECKTPTNISFICPGIDYFDIIMPGQKNNIKIGTPYVLGNHKLYFYVYNRVFVKRPPTDSDIFILYPFETMKEKEVIKLCEKLPSTKKVICLSRTCEKPDKKFGEYLPSFFSLKPPEAYTYYNNMMQKLNDMK